MDPKQEPSAEAKPIEKSQKATVSRSLTIGIVLIVAVVSFIVGARLKEIPYLKSYSSPTESLNFSSVQETYDLLTQKYAAGDLDNNKLIEGAKRGLVAAAGDPYTVYFSDEEAKKFLSDLEGTFTGIGAELSKKDQKLTIVTTLDDSPAKKAGLLKGDNIVKVNDQDASAWSVDEAVAKIRGEKGTTVKLSVLRDGSEVKEFRIVRDTINNPSVTYKIDKNNIGYLRISRFAQTDTNNLTRRAAEEFKSKGVKGVILDLRGNGGGYITAAQEVASVWLGSGKTVVSERKGDKVIEELKTSGDPILEGIKTAVLIDGGSASASEIVAGALHDYKVATLVGEKSFGKGSVQEIVDAPGGGQIKVTIAQWFTPNGKNISKEGIQPDIKAILNAKDIKANRDPQKDKATQTLK